MTSFDDIRSILQQARVALPSTTTPAASARSSQQRQVCPPPVLERDSRERAAPPAVTPGPIPPRGNGAQVSSSPRDPATEPPVRPPGAPAWLRIGGRGARERYARGDGVCLWTNKERRPRVAAGKASPDDVRDLLRRLHPTHSRPAGGVLARGALGFACWAMNAGISRKVIPRVVRAQVAG